MSVAVQDQTQLDERIVEDADLEAALEERDVAKVAAGKARKAYKDADDKARGAIEALELEEGDAARVGRFRVEKSSVAARSVSFETAPTTRLNIRVVEPAGDGE